MAGPAVESVEIARRPEHVFAYVSDPLTAAEWDASVVSVEREDPCTLAIGSRTKVMHKLGPWKSSTIEELIDLKPPREWASRGVSGPLAGTARGTVEALNGGQRSRLTIALSIEARGLGKLLLPIARRISRNVLPKNLQRMKKALERSDGR